MKHSTNKLLSFIFLIAIAVGLLSGMAQAADVSYIVRTYDETNKQMQLQPERVLSTRIISFFLLLHAE